MRFFVNAWISDIKTTLFLGVTFLLKGIWAVKNWVLVTKILRWRSE
jgi:hypothetical protein